MSHEFFECLFHKSNIENADEEVNSVIKENAKLMAKISRLEAENAETPEC